MLSLGPIKWLGGYTLAAMGGGFIVTRILEAVWSGAPEIVHAVGFHRDVDADSDVGNDE